jgi:ferric-dicitrate binding protein FerR (iron transport regulator)
LQRALRAWAGQPPALAAREARQRLRARLETRGPARRPALWAAALVAGAVAAALVVRAPQSRLEPPPAFSTGGPGPAMIVFELDSGTRLYFTPRRDPSGRS